MEMPTETQKNFKKEMREIEKEMKSKKQRIFYSFVKRDHISNYYEKKKTKKIIISSISLGSIIFIMWNLYAISTWINPIFKIATGKNIYSVSIFSSLLGNKHKEIAEYLEQTKELESDLGIVMNDLGNGTNNTFQTESERDNYLNTLDIYEGQLNEKITNLEKIEPPQELENYHQDTLQLLRYSLDMIYYAYDIVSSNDVESINEYNEVINQYNEQSHNRRLHLIKVFNEVKMEYKIMDDQTIEYTWKEM